MTQILKPIFTPEELDEAKTFINVGYKPYEIPRGKDFGARTKIGKKLTIAKEKVNGTWGKRQAHEEINKFGWARFDKEAGTLTFGLKWKSFRGPSEIGESAIKKYRQLLEYYLNIAGWVDIEKKYGPIDDSDYDFVIKLDNMANIENLYKLSPSIGFYYKTTCPEKADIEQLKALVKSKEAQSKLNSSDRGSR